MSDTKKILGLIAGASASAVIYAVAVSRKRKFPANRDMAADRAAAWKNSTPESFTGWLERLKLAIGEEVKQPKTAASSGLKDWPAE